MVVEATAGSMFCASSIIWVLMLTILSFAWGVLKIPYWRAYTWYGNNQVLYMIRSTLCYCSISNSSLLKPSSPLGELGQTRQHPERIWTCIWGDSTKKPWIAAIWWSRRCLSILSSWYVGRIRYFSRDISLPNFSQVGESGSLHQKVDLKVQLSNSA